MTAEQKLSTAVGIVSSTEAINTIDNAYGVESDIAFVLYVVPNAEGKLEVKKGILGFVILGFVRFLKSDHVDN